MSKLLTCKRRLRLTLKLRLGYLCKFLLPFVASWRLAKYRFAYSVASSGDGKCRTLKWRTEQQGWRNGRTGREAAVRVPSRRLFFPHPVLLFLQPCCSDVVVQSCIFVCPVIKTFCVRLWLLINIVSSRYGRRSTDHTALWFQCDDCLLWFLFRSLLEIIVNFRSVPIALCLSKTYRQISSA